MWSSKLMDPTETMMSWGDFTPRPWPDRHNSGLNIATKTIGEDFQEHADISRLSSLFIPLMVCCWEIWCASSSNYRSPFWPQHYPYLSRASLKSSGILHLLLVPHFYCCLSVRDEHLPALKSSLAPLSPSSFIFFCLLSCISLRTFCFFLRTSSRACLTLKQQIRLRNISSSIAMFTLFLP